MSTIKPTTYTDVESALADLDSWRADDRTEWIRIGQAVHSWDQGADGEDLWVRWSQASPKFKANECERIWRGFRSAKGITISTLFAAAQQDGWKRDSQPVEQREAQSTPIAPQEAPEAAQRPGKPAPATKYFWPSIEIAREALRKCPKVVDHPATLQWLELEYGLDETLFDIDSWFVFEHPGSKNCSAGPGIVYTGKSPKGEPCLKFKTLKRFEKVDPKTGEVKHKRETTTLFRAGDGAAIILERPDSPLVIVCGEEKAAAVHQLGYAVLSPITGENPLSSEWVKWIIDHRTDYASVIFANDHDDAGRAANIKSAEALTKAGWPRPRIQIIEWPADAPIGYDINDALKDCKATALIQQAPCPFPRRSLLTVNEILSLKLPDDDNLLADRMLAESEMLAVLGQGGIGKSRLVLQLAICAIMGWDWLGLRTHATGRRWLFFQTENSARRLTHDLANMVRGWKREDIDYLSDRLIIQANLSDIDFATSLSDEANVQSLVDEAAALAPAVIVCDPLSDFLAGDDLNNEMTMKATLFNIRRIMRAASPKTASIEVHHARGGRAAASGAVGWDRSEFGLGSKALFRSVRGQINIALGGDDERNPPLIVACGKNNNGKRFDRRAVRFEEHRSWYEIDPDFNFDEWDRAVTATKVRRGQTGRRGLDIDDSSIMVRLDNGEWHRQADIVHAISTVFNVADNTVKHRLHDMLERGILEHKREKTGAYQISFWRTKCTTTPPLP